jgi:hypothetical protein
MRERRVDEGPGRIGRRGVVTGLAATALGLVVARPAMADSLTPEEKARLHEGHLVRRDHAFEHGSSRYVGGVVYLVIQAPLKEIMAVLNDVSTYTKIFPLTAEATEVGRRGGDRLIRLKHWTRFATASYTVHVRRESQGLLRFWMDASFPHDLEDCWGYYRLQPLAKATTLLTYGAALDLGDGLTRMLFEGLIQGYAMRPPELLRRFVESGARSLPGR